MASYKKSTVDSSIPAYPDPEPFAVPGPCWSTISHQYFVDSGVLPGPELMQELLQKYWNRIPRTDRSKQPANGDSNFHGHHTEEDPASRNQRSINHNSTQDAARRISTVRFSHNRLALVPFLGPSPAEIYEGPLFATMLFQPTPMLRHTPMLEDSPRPSHKQDGSIKVQTHLPLTREYILPRQSCHVSHVGHRFSGRPPT